MNRETKNDLGVIYMLYKATVEFDVEAKSEEDAKDEAIFGMDAGEIAISHNSILKVEKENGQ